MEPLDHIDLGRSNLQMPAAGLSSPGDKVREASHDIGGGIRTEVFLAQNALTIAGPSGASDRAGRF